MLTVDTFVGILSFGVACFGLGFALGSLHSLGRVASVLAVGKYRKAELSEVI